MLVLIQFYLKNNNTVQYDDEIVDDSDDVGDVKLCILCFRNQ